jgi:hypothetical protein
MSAVDKAEDLPAETDHERSEQQKRRSITVEKRDGQSLPAAPAPGYTVMRLRSSLNTTNLLLFCM